MDPLRKSFLLLGRALIKSYREDWLDSRHKIDRIIEDIVMETNSLEADRVQGGVKLPSQQRMLEIKEKNKEYKRLTHDIEKMESLLCGLTEDQMIIVEMHHWQGIPWYEIAKIICTSRTTFFRIVHEIEETIGILWCRDKIDD